MRVSYPRRGGRITSRSAARDALSVADQRGVQDDAALDRAGPALPLDARADDDADPRRGVELPAQDRAASRGEPQPQQLLSTHADAAAPALAAEEPPAQERPALRALGPRRRLRATREPDRAALAAARVEPHGVRVDHPLVRDLEVDERRPRGARGRLFR